MTIWSRISEALAALTFGEGLGAVFGRLRTPPERSVGFTIAVIALGAKLAKSDGQVTRDEVAAFRRVFIIPPGEEPAAARVFNLARQDVAGFEHYARQIAAMFRGEEQVLCDLMEGLFTIALADGVLRDVEEEFLWQVATIFGLDRRRFLAIRASFGADLSPDPYAVLGLGAGASLADARAAWRAAVFENHPDRMAARGVPHEACALAEQRIRAVNAAWADISQAAMMAAPEARAPSCPDDEAEPVHAAGQL